MVISNSLLVDYCTEYFKSYAEGKYLDIINKKSSKGETFLVVDYHDITDVKVTRYIDTEKHEVILKHLNENAKLLKTAMEGAFKNIMKEFDSDFVNENEARFIVRISGSDRQIEIPDINDQTIGEFVSIEGIISGIDDNPRSLFKTVVYECLKCNLKMEVETKKMINRKPRECEECASKVIEVNDEESKKHASTYKRMELQQLPERVDPDRIAASIDCVLEGSDLTNEAIAGDRVRIVGFVSLIPTQERNNALSKFYVEVNYLESLGNADIEESKYEEELKILINEQNEDEIFDKLVNSICPSITGEQYKIIKMALLLQGVGAPALKKEDGSRVRGDINILLAGDPGCLVGDSMVTLGNGKFVRIKSFGKQHLQHINMEILNGRGINKDVAKQFHIYKEQKTIELITTSGRSIRGTHNHPMLVWNGNNREFQWKRLDKIQIGDKIRVIHKVPCNLVTPIKTNFTILEQRFGQHYKGRIPEYMTEGLAGFIGYMIGDGWIHSNGYRLGFVVNEQEYDLIDKLISITDKEFGLKPSITTRTPNQFPAKIDGRKLNRSMNLRYVEYNSKPICTMLSFIKDKRIPSYIFESPNNVVCSFLAWLFEADGTVVFKKNLQGGKIMLSQKNIGLLRDVQLILSRFGIHSNIVDKNLIIGTYSGVMEFVKHIGFKSKKKTNKLGQLVKLFQNTNKKYRHGVSRTEKVKKIVYHEEPITVYDISVPKTHSFMVNGMTSHNTAKTDFCQGMRRCYRRSVYASNLSTKVGLTGMVVLGKNGEPSKIRPGAVMLSNGGLCITGDNRIYVGNRLMQIEDIWNMSVPLKDYENICIRKVPYLRTPVYAQTVRHDSESLINRITRKYYEGELVELTFSSGLKLKCTPEHKIRKGTLKAKWIEAGKINVGQEVKSPNKIFSPNITLDIDERDSYLLGFIYGDGYIKSGRINSITINQSYKKNSDIIKHLKSISKYDFSEYKTEPKERKIGKYSVIECNTRLWTSSNKLVSMCEELLNPNISKIAMLKDLSLASFFAGILDSDGDINKNNGFVTSIRIYPTKDEYELEIILYLLRRFGIKGSIRNSQEIPIIQITGHNIDKFIETVKPYSVKINRERLIHNSVGRKDNSIEKVISVKKLPFSGYVYDLQVLHNSHNFVAGLTYIHNCIVDELDKLEKDDLTALTGVMDDSQRLSFNKGDISKEFHIRVSNLHACNPEGGRWDNDRSLAENLPNFAYWLFDRYDSKFILKSIEDVEQNEKISKHIIKTLMTSVTEQDYDKGIKPIKSSDYFPSEFMREYFEYCKNHFSPKLSFSNDMFEKVDSLAKGMHDFFMFLKKSEYTKDITFREHNIVFRWALASARAHMRAYVKPKDFEIAKTILISSMISCGLDIERIMKGENSEQPSLSFGNQYFSGIPESSNMKRERVEYLRLRKIFKEIIRRQSSNYSKWFLKEDARNNLYKVTDLPEVADQVIEWFIKNGMIEDAPGTSNMFNVTPFFHSKKDSIR